jgi:predicted HTH transcriptional regulator
MIETPEEILSLITDHRLQEYRIANIELKSSWDQDNGKKISAFSNRLSNFPHWMCVGIADDGSLCGYSESWAKKTEETISQQINKFLDPQIACLGINCHHLANKWFILIKYFNPGSVVYWNNSAYKASGTTIELMTPEEIMQLTVSLPGLTDFSAQTWTGQYDQSKVVHFAETVSERRRETPLVTIKSLSSEDVLERLGIKKTNTQRILFGDIQYRVVKYDKDSNPVSNAAYAGLYGMLQPSFIDEIQEWSKIQLDINSEAYPIKALKEGLANAVAHAAYFDSAGDVIVELFPDKVCISNLCLRESQYFANKWFSRSHKTINRV